MMTVTINLTVSRRLSVAATSLLVACSGTSRMAPQPAVSGIDEPSRPAEGAAGGSAPGMGVRWIGRADARDPDNVKFAWSGSGFVANVTGTKVSVRLHTEGSAAFFQPVIDGIVGERFRVENGGTETVVLGDNLPAGSHRVELYRDTEGMYGYSVFLGFVDGTVNPPPAAPGRLLEVIGDSISAGYGNLGVQTHPPWDNTCTFSLETESAYQAYSWQLARLLKADVSIIARSGWGVYRDNNGDTAGVLSSVYSNTLGTQPLSVWDFAPQPDAVLINLGTNDSAKGDPGQPYEDAYVKLLGTVRSHYPRAWIFLTIGTMTTEPMLTTMVAHLANVVRKIADPKVVKIDIPMQDPTSTGCDYHPNVAEDRKMAEALRTPIAEKLGW